jgi:hypothetical protein
MEFIGMPDLLTILIILLMVWAFVDDPGLFKSIAEKMRRGFDGSDRR